MAENTITIQYARLKLGKKGEKMTDKQIENLLAMLRQMCNKTIDLVIDDKYDNRTSI